MVVLFILGQQQLLSFIHSLNNEQRKICSEAANLSLSSTRLYQRLVICKRYFIALNRAPHISHSEMRSNVRKRSTDILETKTVKISSKKHNLDPVMGLARVGSRAALNFSFAFLRRAWRLGEDTDLCSELLQESLEAMRLLPVATMFDETKVSAVWLEIVEKSIKFLRQVVTGFVCV